MIVENRGQQQSVRYVVDTDRCCGCRRCIRRCQENVWHWNEELSTRSAACGSNPLGEMTRWLPYGSPRMVESPFCSEILYF